MRRRCGACLVVRPDRARVRRDRVPDGLARPGLPVASAVNLDGRRGFQVALWGRAMNDAPLFPLFTSIRPPTDADGLSYLRDCLNSW
jgi:hypothetical protein